MSRLTFIAAWLVVRYRGAARWALDVLISVPLVFPGIVLGITLLIQFLRLPMIPIYGTIWILVFAFLIRFMPYGMRFCHAGILAVHRELEECGRTCGATMFTVLRRIVLPLALPSVAAALALRVPPHHPRSVARDPAGRAGQPRWWPSSFSICGTMAKCPNWPRWRCCWPQASLGSA